MFAKGRAHIHNPSPGERNGSAKLTESDVRAIRTAYANGEPKERLAEQYAVDPSNIIHIVLRKTWRHVE
jgi:hypothetical protein